MNFFEIWLGGYVIAISAYIIALMRFEDRKPGCLTAGLILFLAWPLTVPYVVLGTAWKLMAERRIIQD